VFHKRQQGKGNGVRRMFALIDADVYIMMDSDPTYDADAAWELVRRLRAQWLDLVAGARVTDENARTAAGIASATGHPQTSPAGPSTVPSTTCSPGAR